MLLRNIKCWIMVGSLPFTHEFELEGDEAIELKLSCRKSEVIHKMRLIFGRDVEVELFKEEEEYETTY